MYPVALEGNGDREPRGPRGIPDPADRPAAPLTGARLSANGRPSAEMTCLADSAGWDAGDMGGAVRQLRLVVEAEDYEAAVAFYRDTLGLVEEEGYQDGEARVVILGAGRATLEIVNAQQKALIDDVEVGRPVAPHIRVAFEVADATTVTQELAAAGARVVAPATSTPWRSVNARLDAPAGLHITVFQEPDDGR